MRRAQEQARAFPIEPLSDGVDLTLPGFLFGDEVVQAENQQRVRVRGTLSSIGSLYPAWSMRLYTSTG